MLIWIVGIVSSLGLIGAIVAVVVVPGVAIPILQNIVGALLKCKPCLAVIAAIALLFAGSLYGVHVEKARADKRIEQMREQAAAAAKERDESVKADLEKTFTPQLAQLQATNKTLQDKVRDYEKRKPVAGKPVCHLGDAAGVLQPGRAREPAGATAGGIADYLRKHSGAGHGARSKPAG